VSSTESRWKRVLRLQIVPFLLFALVVFALCGAVAWLAERLPLGHGQYAMNLVNQRGEAVVARTNDGLGAELAPCQPRQVGMAYVRGQQRGSHLHRHHPAGRWKPVPERLMHRPVDPGRRGCCRPPTACST
jgi:hypothetical protein